MIVLIMIRVKINNKGISIIVEYQSTKNNKGM